MSTPDQLRVVEQAIEKTRKDAIKQLLIGAGFAVLWIFVLKPQTWVWILIGINVLIWLIFMRRLYRLRAGSPAVQALLTAPERIASITGFPAKVPANQVPVFIDVRTRDGDVCTLLQAPKQPQATVALVSALSARSPEATVAVANVPLAKPADPLPPQ